MTVPFLCLMFFATDAPRPLGQCWQGEAVERCVRTLGKVTNVVTDGSAWCASAESVSSFLFGGIDPVGCKAQKMGV
jgi:hypothetical protein